MRAGVEPGSHEAVITRNRRRIVAVAVVSLLNYWVSSIALTIAVVIGASLDVLFDGLGDLVEFFEDGDALVALAWVGGIFVVVGTLVGIVLMLGRLALIEHRVLLETHAQLPAAGEHPKVDNLMEGLAISAGVPAPRLVVVDDPAPNSFAVGRKPERAVVGLTTGLMQAATRDELEAALAYQISRVASLDVALSTWTVALTGRTIELYDRTERLSVKLALFLPVALAWRLRRVAMRGQAEQRDMLAVRFTRHPSALLSLLEKLDADQARVAGISRSSAPLWLEYHERDATDVLPARIAVLRSLLAEPGEPASPRSPDTPTSSAGPGS